MCPWSVDPVLNRWGWRRADREPEPEMKHRGKPMSGPGAKACLPRPNEAEPLPVTAPAPPAPTLPSPPRGVALEALGRYEEAIADYRAVLAAAPDDPAA